MRLNIRGDKTFADCRFYTIKSYADFIFADEGSFIYMHIHTIDL